MGQKVNPIGLRIGINRTWDSRWFARHDYANLPSRFEAEKYIHDRLAQAGVSKIVVNALLKKARVTFIQPALELLSQERR
jgi:small subunit ribosomal protein S3